MTTHEQTTEDFIKLGYPECADESPDNGLFYAAKLGSRHSVNYFIKKGSTHWNNGMCGAALGGHKHLVDFFIEKGATDLNKGLYWAAKGGHLDVVKFFIEKGANDWVAGLDGAQGHQDIIDFITKKKNAPPTNREKYEQD